jgi:hypothetical protein
LLSNTLWFTHGARLPASLCGPDVLTANVARKGLPTFIHSIGFYDMPEAGHRHYDTVIHVVGVGVIVEWEQVPFVPMQQNIKKGGRKK